MDNSLNYATPMPKRWVATSIGTGNIMKRRTALIGLLAVITVAALLFVAPLGAQSETESVPEDLLSLFAPTETVVLAMGEALETPEWDLQVQNAFVAPSPEENGYSEVKIAIVMRNNLEVPIPYRIDGFHSTLGYPRLTVTDSAGNSYPYSLNRLSAVALPGSNLIDILPGLSGRWTVGFRVLTPFADDMTLEATGSTAIGQWALTPGGALDGFPPPDIKPAGDEIAWSEDLVVKPRNHGSIVCGDPDRQLVTQIFAIAMDVMNEGTTDRLFPGTRYPGDVAIAQWPNGAASRMVAETHSGDVEALQWAQDATVIAPGETQHARSMVFAVPRDGRLGLVDDDPQGILFQLPDGRQTWLDISGEGSLMLDPAFCDNGALLGPTPYGFAPGPAFDVAFAELGIDNVTANRAAIELVNEAAVAAAALIGPSGDFGDITPSALAATGSPLSFATGLAAGAPDVVGVEVFPDEDGVAFSTQSHSGLWYCLTLDPQGGLATFYAFNSEAVATLCLPLPAEAPEGEAAIPEGEGPIPKTTEPPTTTTVPATTTTSTTSTTTSTIPQTPSLTIVKVVDLATISAPGTLTYTITVDNTGNVDLTNVVLTDIFAGGATLDSGDDGDNILETTETWIYTADYDVTAADILDGFPLVNTASVDTDQTAPASDNATTTII